MVKPAVGTAVPNNPKSAGAGFVAGTLVHTDKGLVPIEKLKIGDLVLSQSEGGGEKAYKPVIRAMVHDDQDVCSIWYCDLGGDQSTTTTLFATENHPFLVEEIGWIQARDLANRHFLQLANGNQGLVTENLPLYRTSNANIACEYDEDTNKSHCLEFDETGLIALPEGEIDLNILYSKDPYFKVRVYNIEVADFHTYFIKKEGILVHNATCQKVTADDVLVVDGSPRKAEAKARLDSETYFAAGTSVHTKEGLRPIEELKVGDLVLTWPEDMPMPKRARLPDEYIYKPVTKTFVHEDTMISHVPLLGTGVGKDEILRATPNHPVFSEEYGWLPFSALKPSYSLIWADFSNASIRRMKHDVERVTAYNIEVEDCHTYFVGKMGLWVHNKGN